MLKIYDQNHRQLGMLTQYTDLKLEKDLENADGVLSFTVKNPDEIILKNEYYIRTRTDEFVIKKISHKNRAGMSVTCNLNLEELQGQPFGSFVVTDVTIKEAAESALNETGWSVGYCDVNKIRSAGMVDCDALKIVSNLCTAWMCEHDFDTLHKKVNFYQRKGSRKGAYFIDGLNLKQLTKETDSCNYYTAIIPYGKDGLTIESVNGGKNYLENHQYSRKKIAYIWKDESYTDPQKLKEDAGQKLAEIAKPKELYTCSVTDLASQRKEYEILSYDLGDEVKLINRETKTLTWQRITKIVSYPENPEKNTCDLSSTVLTFTEMQEKLKRAAEIVNYVITSDGRVTGKISVSDILNFEAGIAKSETLQGFDKELSAVQKEVATLTDSVENIGNLREQFAELEKANVPDEWVETRLLKNQSVTAEKVDVKNITNSIFDQVIQGAQFADTYLQNPTISGAVIDAESVTVNGKDVMQMLEDLSGLYGESERLARLEEKVNRIIEELEKVLADE